MASCREEGRVDVGVLEGAIIQRPNYNFYDEADAISSEMQELSIVFCDRNGVASRVRHPKLMIQNTAVQSGGFFNIYSMEIKPSHQGQDLGLRMMHEVFVLLKYHWTLAVMVPDSMAFRFQGNPPNVPNIDRKGAKRKVQKHFCRLGFVQAGSKLNLIEKIFLTSSMYFSGNDDNYDKNHAISCWLSKDQANQIMIHKETERHEPTGMDKNLADLIRNHKPPRVNDLVSQALAMLGVAAPPAENEQVVIAAINESINSMVNRGASIHNSRALFLAAAKDTGNDAYLLKTLVSLGGQVNAKDETGTTPLHVAASIASSRNVEYLVGAGADISATNHDGETPLQLLQTRLRDLQDFGYASGGLAPRDLDFGPKIECLGALMPPPIKALLIDGWMSPQMRRALLITAELQEDDIVGYGQGMARLYYIPYSILAKGLENQSHPNCPNNFIRGWISIWSTMATILRSNQAPTFARIQQAAPFARTL